MFLSQGAVRLVILHQMHWSPDIAYKPSTVYNALKVT